MQRSNLATRIEVFWGRSFYDNFPGIFLSDGVFYRDGANKPN